MDLFNLIKACKLKNPCFSGNINQAYLNSLTTQEQINQLYWIMCHFLELAQEDFETLLQQFLAEFFENSFINCIYIKETETIRLAFKHPETDTTSHSYDNETLIISEPKKGVKND